MIVNLNKIYYYFITCNNKIRKEHLSKEFENYKLVEINPIMGIKRFKSGATGFSKVLDQACLNQNKNEPFQPFIIFEDDVKKYRDFPSDIEIPDDTDILYIGLSTCGKTDKSYCHTVCSKNVNKDIIRIYNMLATHGMMICSMRGLLTLQKCMLEAYFLNAPWDTHISQSQPFLNVYALKNPLVYQYGKIGGNQPATKIDYIDKVDTPIPKKWIIKNNVSILTMNDKKL